MTLIQTVRATITRGEPYCHQTQWTQTTDPNSGYNGPHTYSSPLSYTISDFQERDFYRWDVRFPHPFTPYSKTCYTHSEAMQYATRTVRNLRKAAR